PARRLPQPAAGARSLERAFAAGNADPVTLARLIARRSSSPESGCALRNGCQEIPFERVEAAYHVFRLLAHISNVSLSLSHVTHANRSDGTTAAFMHRLMRHSDGAE